MKSYNKIFIVMFMLILFSFSSIIMVEAAENNSRSSLDAITEGLADGNKDDRVKNIIVPSTEPYTLAILPYIDQSGMEEKNRKVAANAVKNALKKKYPVNKKDKIHYIATAKEVELALRKNQFENSNAPTLAELVAVGDSLGVDRIIYIAMNPVRSKETGFRVIVGSQTYSSVISMNLKCVDVQKQKYLFNEMVEEIGSSSAVSFWKFGGASQSRAIKKGVLNCMEEFLCAFD